MKKVYVVLFVSASTAMSISLCVCAGLSHGNESIGLAIGGISFMLVAFLGLFIPHK